MAANSTPLPASRSWILLERALLLLILACGAFLRFYQLDSLPPGLYTDEAYYALDALDVIGGARPIYFPANNGREPLFIYSLAVSISALGRTPLAVRLPAAIFGTLDILAAYALGRVLFGRRVGLMVAALTAGSLWAVALSRIGLRATTFPPLAAFMLACAAHGWRTRRRWMMSLAGALCGLCFYTYLSARLTAAPLIGFGIFWYSARRLRGQRPGVPLRILIRDLAAFILPATLVVAPLVLYAFREPQIYLGRVEQVSVFSGGLAQSWAALLNNLGAVLGMFAWQGDLNARHNLPGRPVFDPALAAIFWIGVALSAWRMLKRGDDASALALLWSGTMLAPTVLSDHAPHFLRAIGAIPMVFVFPALALDIGWRWTLAGQVGNGSQGPGVLRYRQAVPLLVIGLIGLNAARTAYDYFGLYARDPNTALYFQSAVVDLAEGANAYLRDGQRTLFLDRRLWDTFPAVRFLLLPGPALTLVATGAAPDPPLTGEARAIVWPYDDAPWAAVRWLPERGIVAGEWGALYRNDEEPQPYPLYAVYGSRPLPTTPPEPLAEFQGIQAPGIILRAADVVSTGSGWRVMLVWSAEGPVEADVHVFVHLRDGNTIVAQVDGPLGSALYPIGDWRPGDWVSEVDVLNLPPGRASGLRLFTGLYVYPSGGRLKVAGSGQDAVELQLPGH